MVQRGPTVKYTRLPFAESFNFKGRIQSTGKPLENVPRNTRTISVESAGEELLEEFVRNLKPSGFIYTHL